MKSMLVRLCQSSIHGVWFKEVDNIPPLRFSSFVLFQRERHKRAAFLNIWFGFRRGSGRFFGKSGENSLSWLLIALVMSVQKTTKYFWSTFISVAYSVSPVRLTTVTSRVGYIIALPHCCDVSHMILLLLLLLCDAGCLLPAVIRETRGENL